MRHWLPATVRMVDRLVFLSRCAIVADDVRVLCRWPLRVASVAVEETSGAPADVSRGAPIAFHVHNHGANTWQLIELSLER